MTETQGLALNLAIAWGMLLFLMWCYHRDMGRMCRLIDKYHALLEQLNAKLGRRDDLPTELHDRGADETADETRTLPSRLERRD